MNCKYCRKNTHTIDNCPEILCKNCKKYGHPHWKCKKVSSEKSEKSEKSDKKILFQKNLNLKNREIATDNIKNLEDIKKYMNLKWSEICFI